MVNQAIQFNYGNDVNYAGGVANDKITVRGSDVYWATTSVMIVSTLVFCGLAFTKPREKRIFHYITAAITMVASIAYFSMASNIGWAPISVEFLRSGNVAGHARQIFYVRYIDWVITTPLLLMDLLLTSGLPWPTVLFTILIDEIMIVTGLVGALVRSSYKWGYYTFGCVALFWIAYVLLFEAPKHAKGLGKDIHKAFVICGTWTVFLWFLYPVAWGVSEGGNVIASDSEAVFYSVLDCMAKPVFGALLLWGHRNIDPARLGLHIRDYANDDTAIAEKGVSNGASNNATSSAAENTSSNNGGHTTTEHHHTTTTS